MDEYVSIVLSVMVLSINGSACLCLEDNYLLVVTLLTLIGDLISVLNLCEAFLHSNTALHKYTKVFAEVGTIHA